MKSTCAIKLYKKMTINHYSLQGGCTTAATTGGKEKKEEEEEGG
jgi:hypothetical protein